MKDYPLRYAGTDRIKKSHYNSLITAEEPLLRKLEKIKLSTLLYDDWVLPADTGMLLSYFSRLANTSHI